MTSSITDFIEARLAEDEATARATLIDVDGSGDWRADEHPVALTVDLYRVRDVSARPVVEGIRSLDDDDDPDNITEYVNGAAVSQHVARHDPDRVLREVEAKRKLVADFKIELEDAERYEDVDSAATSLRLLGILAAIYSDHPDFNPEWSIT